MVFMTRQAISTFLHKITFFFDTEIHAGSRLLVVISLFLLLPTLFTPLWSITLYSQQYPEGLELEIYTYKFQGELTEINTLNHYIGMAPLKEQDFSELKWLPFALGLFVILALRSVVIGKMANLVDLFVLFTYFGLFSLGSFIFKLYQYGHNLDPTAAINVDPFMPPVFGSEQLANFTAYSYPGVGSISLFLFGAFLVLAILWSARKQTET